MRKRKTLLDLVTWRSSVTLGRGLGGVVRLDRKAEVNRDVRHAGISPIRTLPECTAQWLGSFQGSFSLRQH